MPTAWRMSFAISRSRQRNFIHFYFSFKLFCTHTMITSFKLYDILSCEHLKLAVTIDLICIFDGLKSEIFFVETGKKMKRALELPLQHVDGDGPVTIHDLLDNIQGKPGYSKIDVEDARERQDRLAKLRSLLFRHEMKAKRVKRSNPGHITGC
ncbi:hypothetical protein BS78_03G360400 [Paspalum vaginatum]|nr:hypothetical protein BS78_03G360400 [Paspalum vaginatum]